MQAPKYVGMNYFTSHMFMNTAGGKNSALANTKGFATEACHSSNHFIPLIFY